MLFRSKEHCVFISLEEEVESIVKNASNYGWNLGPFIDSKYLQIIKLDPSDAKSTITRIKSDLTKSLKTFDAKRVVVDSVSLFGMTFPSDLEKRVHLFELSQMIKSSGATSFLTAEVKDDNPMSSKDGLVEYISDGVISLQFYQAKEGGEMLLSMRVVKMRRAKHSRKIKPYSITEKGIVVHSELEVFS